MEYYKTMEKKKKTIAMFKSINGSHENNLSKGSQALKHAYCMNPFIWSTQTGNTNWQSYKSKWIKVGMSKREYNSYAHQEHVHTNETARDYQQAIAKPTENRWGSNGRVMVELKSTSQLHNNPEQWGQVPLQAGSF